MIKRSNNLFLALLASAVLLLGCIVTDNLIGRENLPATGALSSSAVPRPAKKTAPSGLPLHEGKYWKRSNE